MSKEEESEGQTTKTSYKECSLASPKTLARGVQNGGICRLPVDPMALVHESKILCKPSKFEEAYEKKKQWDAITDDFNPILKNDV